MNRREFLKLIPMVIGGAIAAKVANSREKVIGCGSDKTIEELPEDDDHALLCPEPKVWCDNSGCWWCLYGDEKFYSPDMGRTWIECALIDASET